jgi:methanogenic corrinoid protein MtbC1
MSAKAELLKKLSNAIVEMEDDDLVTAAVKEYLEFGYDAREGMLSGLVDGMKRASELYEMGEYFVPELIVCSDAMYSDKVALMGNIPCCSVLMEGTKEAESALFRQVNAG